MTDDGRGMWLRTEVNGVVTDTPAAPLGAVLRIAVGEPGRRSSVWRIWSNRTASDVYVAARTVAGVQKFSFHESGAWRYAWVGTPPGGTADDDRYRPLATQRCRSRWLDQDAIHLGPGRGRDTGRPGDKPDDVEWVPAPAVSKAVGIHLVLADPDLGVVGPVNAVPLVTVALANGQAVIVLVSTSEVDARTRAMIESHRAAGLLAMPKEVRQRSATEPGVRAALFGYDSDGVRWVWDTAAS